MKLPACFLTLAATCFVIPAVAQTSAPPASRAEATAIISNARKDRHAKRN
jgi:hypothetical protein